MARLVALEQEGGQDGHVVAEGEGAVRGEEEGQQHAAHGGGGHARLEDEELAEESRRRGDADEAQDEDREGHPDDGVAGPEPPHPLRLRRAGRRGEEVRGQEGAALLGSGDSGKPVVVALFFRRERFAQDQFG